MEAGKAFNGHVEALDGLQGQCVRGPLKQPLPLKAKSAEDIVELWYKEGSKYNFMDPVPKPQTRNFTQLVWGGTTSVGMAISEDGRFAVANFYPPGNDTPINFPRCVRKVREGPPPWAPRPPAALQVSPLCEQHWEAHAELEESMRRAAERRPDVDENEFDFS